MTRFESVDALCEPYEHRSVGDALDNALMESTIGLYKTELIDRHEASWTGRAELERETASWVHWYNTSATAGKPWAAAGNRRDDVGSHVDSNRRTL